MKPTAYVINLDRRGDRWEVMQRVWSPHFNLVRVSAVDLPGNGRGGCKESHYMVATHYLQNEPMILVFEDDALPCPMFEQIGLKCIEDAAKYIDEWKISNLGPYLDVSCLGMGRADLQPTKSEYFLAASYCQQTHMMLYNERSIPILQMAIRSRLPLDVFIGRAVHDVWVPIHVLATQSDSPSDIPKPRVDAQALYALSEQMMAEGVNAQK